MKDPEIQNHIIHLYQRDMMSSTINYDLQVKEERLRSVSDLERFFFRMMSYIKPSLFVEAGARDAKVSARARRRVEECRIVAFEANPYTYERFRAASWIEDGNISYIHKALSLDNSGVTFTLKSKVGGIERDKTSGDGSINVPLDKSVETEEYLVETTTLDDEFRELKSHDTFMWVDVEGAQRQVLSGGVDFISNKVAAVFIEVEDRALWDDQWLSKDVVRFFLERGFIPYARDYQSRYQYNIVLFSRRYADMDYLMRSYHEYLSSSLVVGRAFSLA